MTVLGVLFQGNIEELYNTDLEGNAAAAVEDCSQRFAIYFDFAQLAEIQAREGPDRPAWLPPEHFDPEACVFNRGVLVVNSKRWMEENITRAIIWWMDEFQKSKRNLYKYRWLLFSLLLQWSLLDVCRSLHSEMSFFSSYGWYFFGGVWVDFPEQVYHNHHSYWHFTGSTKFSMACGMCEALGVQIWVSWRENTSSTCSQWITLGNHLFLHLLIQLTSYISMAHTSPGRENASGKAQMISFHFVDERSEDWNVQNFGGNICLQLPMIS